ncbi:MAG: alpha-hydroxy-acid oxidizing protein [Pseudonocardiaceae bacterium]|nr:alpha-hydroxy-acid oxidizing protein [Pseudonocardiaceae bacterium]
MTRRDPVSIGDLRDRARRRLPRVVFDFVEGGAETEHTARANLDAFTAWNLIPNVLVDVSHRSQQVELFGRRLSTPVLLAPVGIARIAGSRGELAAAEGAVHTGTVSVLSTSSSVPYEAVAQAADEPQWFQLYPWGDRSLTSTLLRMARAAGFEALVVTVDVPIMGGRERDLRNGITSSFRPTPRTCLDMLRRPRWLVDYLRHERIVPAVLSELSAATGRHTPMLAARGQSMINPSHTWDEVDWLRDQWPGPLLLKGILSPEDAGRAARRGVDGVVVSNHGGRQLDFALATLDALPEIRATVGDRVTVLLDGGVRRGTDVVKALALGADAVLIGRPWIYGLAALGGDGPAAVVDLFKAEIDRALALVGRPSTGDLDLTVLRAAGTRAVGADGSGRGAVVYRR